MVQVETTWLTSCALAERIYIDTLKGAESHFDNVKQCQAGTRKNILEDIFAWSQEKTGSKTLFWLHGHAGMGKSSIASSVCRKFKQDGTLGAHFFCKRDSDHRSAKYALNTIIHHLALRSKSYGRIVARAIKADDQLPNLSLKDRYTQLIENPIHKPAKALFVVVDALDECEKGAERGQLLTCLREMSRIVPWLNVIVTSRPDADIAQAFGGSHGTHVTSRDLLSKRYDASGDILAFTQERMAGIPCKPLTAWPEYNIRQLADRAGGLFIWVETACKFIEGGMFKPGVRLKQILDGTQPADGSKPLDMLYTSTIKLSMGDQGADNLSIFRQCLGAIAATTGRTALSVDGLEKLLLSNPIKSDTPIEPGAFRTVVAALGSVLFEDKERGGAVRVYHPSFADFMLDKSRSNEFYVDPGEQNSTMAVCCLETMMRDLKFNICGLETSYVLNRDVTDLGDRIQKRIGQDLQYSCLHWTSHLTGAPKGTHEDRLGRFLKGKELMYWIEVLSLLARLDVGLLSLLELAKWTSVSMPYL